VIRIAPTPFRRARAGLTFVEVVVSVGIVAGAAVLAFGTIGFLERVAQHNIDRLNGTEVAHRVILQLIDDFQSLRDQPHSVEQGGRFYQFDIVKEVLTAEAGIDPSTPRRASQRRSSVRVDTVTAEERFQAQIHQLTVLVFAERPDKTRSPVPVARLVRSYNPMMGLGNRGMKYMIDALEESWGMRVAE
jgi:hypothetical protein